MRNLLLFLLAFFHNQKLYHTQFKKKTKVSKTFLKHKNRQNILKIVLYFNDL